MVARNALVIGERRQRELRPFVRGIAQIDVVGAGTRPIERGALVIAARRARFGEFRHALDLELRARQRAAHFRHARPDRSALERSDPPASACGRRRCSDRSDPGGATRRLKRSVSEPRVMPCARRIASISAFSDETSSVPI